MANCFCRRWVLQYQVHMHARKAVLRQPFREWRALVLRINPARELRRRVLRAAALRTKEYIFSTWHKGLKWSRFVSQMVREYETARLRGLARVALRRWKRWAMRKAIGSEVFRFGMFPCTQQDIHKKKRKEKKNRGLIYF